MADKVKPIPDGYHSVTPYMTVADAQRLLDFLKNAFNAKEAYRMTRPDGSIGHAEVRIGDSMVMIGQAGAAFKPRPATLYLYVPDVDATFKSALAAGGTCLREPQDQFYGDRSGGVEDPLGNQWWIATHVEDVSSQELERRAAQQPPGSN